MNLDNTYSCVRINAPELKSHKQFVQWLHEKSLGSGEDDPLGFSPHHLNRVATWHSPLGANPTPPGEFSDIFTHVDHGEGSDDDMPADVWASIIKIVGAKFYGIVWITFLEYP